ncbi:Tripartite-type tricarboxylate transporter, receptor component TctC [Bosea sp. CRIB-10]|uniref:tripartite tricarboxylate transporter substrate-binding protein n=1 Tax=Bosea sp. CRIB-10 TaxID=378404 RepID=UPI0008E9DB69|nr:tripartite tricarboxylate transporter substrate-binding protein [Bosea sp. CRIB-10]SFD03803.1 Tripartite-type tricarboxylate transporter, receptor component TctC [Bosea sp. CRIB-10]
MKRAALAMLAAIAVLPVQAQDKYPSKPINMLVPFAAGGSSDVIARLVGEEMAQVLGQRIVMENMGGAGGATALTRAARAEPDGYTIVIGNSGTNAASYTIYNDLKYTPADFVPIGLVAKTSPMIALKLGFPAKDLNEFLAYAKANPGKISLGHAGVGSSNYLICRNFLKASGLDVALVSYRGAGPALNDLMGGQIDGVCDAATSLSGAVQGNKVKALVVATPQRLPSLPDVPTSTEAGLPAFQAQGWNAIFAPKGTPQPVIDKLNQALRTALSSEKLHARFKELSSVLPEKEEMSPEFVAKMVPAEIEKYKVLLSDGK